MSRKNRDKALKRFISAFCLGTSVLGGSNIGAYKKVSAGPRNAGFASRTINSLEGSFESFKNLQSKDKILLGGTIAALLGGGVYAGSKIFGQNVTCMDTKIRAVRTNLEDGKLTNYYYVNENADKPVFHVTIDVSDIVDDKGNIDGDKFDKATFNSDFAQSLRDKLAKKEIENIVDLRNLDRCTIGALSWRNYLNNKLGDKFSVTPDCENPEALQLPNDKNFENDDLGDSFLVLEPSALVGFENSKFKIGNENVAEWLKVKDMKRYIRESFVSSIELIQNDKEKILEDNKNEIEKEVENYNKTKNLSGDNALKSSDAKFKGVKVKKDKNAFYVFSVGDVEFEIDAKAHVPVVGIGLPVRVPVSFNGKDLNAKCLEAGEVLSAKINAVKAENEKIKKNFEKQQEIEKKEKEKEQKKKDLDEAKKYDSNAHEDAKKQLAEVKEKLNDLAAIKEVGIDNFVGQIDLLGANNNFKNSKLKLQLADKVAGDFIDIIIREKVNFDNYLENEIEAAGRNSNKDKVEILKKYSTIFSEIFMSIRETVYGYSKGNLNNNSNDNYGKFFDTVTLNNSNSVRGLCAEGVPGSNGVAKVANVNNDLVATLSKTALEYIQKAFSEFTAKAENINDYNSRKENRKTIDEYEKRFSRIKDINEKLLKKYNDKYSSIKNGVDLDNQIKNSEKTKADLEKRLTKFDRIEELNKKYIDSGDIKASPTTGS